MPPRPQPAAYDGAEDGVCAAWADVLARDEEEGLAVMTMFIDTRAGSKDLIEPIQKYGVEGGVSTIFYSSLDLTKQVCPRERIHSQTRIIVFLS